MPALSSLDAAQIQWIIKTGFAPLFCFLSRTDYAALSSVLWAQLKGSDLSIRVLHELQLNVLTEILDKSKNLLRITLLKGCSIATEFYPLAHLRIMRDLDLLIDEKHQASLESLLREMGFRQQSTNSAEYYLTHHHSMPFYQPSSGVWVEVHRGLFPPSGRLGKLSVFRHENVEQESRFSFLLGKAVMRLSPELQIVYTASHWAMNLIALKHEGGLFPLMDTILILNSVQRNVRWELIFNWVKGSVAASHLYLLFSYLHENEILEIDRGVLRELFDAQRSFGIVNLNIAHRLITRYLARDNIPIAPGKLSILWESLLLDRGPTANLLNFCKQIWRSSRLSASRSPTV